MSVFGNEFKSVSNRNENTIGPFTDPGLFDVYRKIGGESGLKRRNGLSRHTPKQVGHTSRRKPRANRPRYPLETSKGAAPEDRSGRNIAGY